MTVLGIYLVGVVFFLIVALCMFSGLEARLGARTLLLSPVWPVAIIWGLVLLVIMLFRVAEWVPKKQDPGVHLHDPRYLPTENGGQRRAPGAGEMKPMTERPQAPRKWDCGV